MGLLVDRQRRRPHRHLRLGAGLIAAPADHRFVGGDPEAVLHHPGLEIDVGREHNAGRPGVLAHHRVVELGQYPPGVHRTEQGQADPPDKDHAHDQLLDRRAPPVHPAIQQQPDGKRGDEQRDQGLPGETVDHLVPVADPGGHAGQWSVDRGHVAAMDHAVGEGRVHRPHALVEPQERVEQLEELDDDPEGHPDREGQGVAQPDHRTPDGVENLAADPGGHRIQPEVPVGRPEVA